MALAFEDRPTTERVMVAARCNKCGESCLVEHGPGIPPDFYGAHVGFSTGYYSKALGDGQTFNFELCEACLKVLMDGFVLTPHVQEWL